MVNTLVRESHATATLPLPALDSSNPRVMISRLESWLRQEELNLRRARDSGRVLPRREARWQELLGLYERLSNAGAR